jgi:hypothetical protein
MRVGLGLADQQNIQSNHVRLLVYITAHLPAVLLRFAIPSDQHPGPEGDFKFGRTLVRQG